MNNIIGPLTTLSEIDRAILCGYFDQTCNTAHWKFRTRFISPEIIWIVLKKHSGERVCFSTRRKCDKCPIFNDEIREFKM